MIWRRGAEKTKEIFFTNRTALINYVSPVTKHELTVPCILMSF